MDSSNEELLARYEAIVNQYLEMCPKLAKQLEDFGRLRNELQVLSVELKKRNLDAPINPET